MLSLLLFFGLTTLIIIAYDFLAFSLKLTSWRRFAATFLLFYFQITTSELLLGVLTELTRRNLLILNVLISAFVIAFALKKGKRSMPKAYISSTLKSLKSSVKDLRGDNSFIVLVTLATLSVLYIMFLGLIFPVTDFDGNSYHLTTVGYALQNSSIHDVQTSLPWLKGYPKGGELIALWNVIFLRKDVFADFIQIPFLMLGIYALYEIARWVGVAKKNARFGALLFVFVPVVLNQMKTTYVDLMLCSLFFASMAIVIKRKLTKLDLVILGVSYYFILSLKFTGVLFVAATVPFLIYNLYQANKKLKVGTLRAYITQFGLVIIPVLPAMYWYVKNLVLYNTPIFPFGFKIAGVSVFPGKTFQEFADGANASVAALPKNYFSRILFSWSEQTDWYGCFYNYDTNFAGFGPLWVVLLLPAGAIALYIAVKKRNYRLLSLFGSFAVLFFLYPSNYYTRYTLFITGLGMVAFAFVLGYLKSATVSVVKVLAIVLALIVMGTNISLCNYPPSSFNGQIYSIEHKAFKTGPTYQTVIGESYVFLQNTISPGEVVVYDSSPYYIYPLWRQDFQNKVIYIMAEDKDEWYAKVSSENVKYIFTTVYGREHAWISEDAKYPSVYKDNQYEIFKVY